MADTHGITEESAAVQAHLSIMQSVIQRMSANSTSCKAWCIALVSAVLVIVADKGRPEFAQLAGIPMFLFLVLDMYYLGLERAFRDSYNAFIGKLHDRTLEPNDLFIVAPKSDVIKKAGETIASPAIWPFYLTLFVMILVAQFALLPEPVAEPAAP